MLYSIDINDIYKNSYRFVIYETHTPMPYQSGIYVFLKNFAPQEYELLYIGETENFHERIHMSLEYHNAWNCAIRNGITHLGICPFSGSKQQRLDIETNLRNTYPSTPCNLQ